LPTSIAFGFIPIVPDVQSSTSVAQATVLAGRDFLLVPSLLSGGLVEGGRPSKPAETVPHDSVFALFLPPGQVTAVNRDNLAAGEKEGDTVVLPPDAPEPHGWEALPLGLHEPLRKRLKLPPPAEDNENKHEAPQETLESIESLPDCPIISADALPAARKPETWSAVCIENDEAEEDAWAEPSSTNWSHAPAPDVDVELFANLDLLPASAVFVWLAADDSAMSDDG
jgi:hypothetical protein